MGSIVERKKIKQLKLSNLNKTKKIHWEKSLGNPHNNSKKYKINVIAIQKKKIGEREQVMAANSYFDKTHTNTNTHTPRHIIAKLRRVNSPPTPSQILKESREKSILPIQEQ